MLNLFQHPSRDQCLAAQWTPKQVEGDDQESSTSLDPSSWWVHVLGRSAADSAATVVQPSLRSAAATPPSWPSGRKTRRAGSTPSPRSTSGSMNSEKPTAASSC